jgi:alpha-L-fucosidase
MKNILGWVLYFLLLAFSTKNAQGQNKGYFSPGDSLVEKKLLQWKDYKFGLLIHWGTYSQWGIVESWSICPEDENWCQRNGPYSDNYYKYVQAYENLQSTFNPDSFNPEKWAVAAKRAGMKYLVFTTKHHDGFCMFDTKETDYKITSPKTPYSKNPHPDITKELFSAFRKEGFMIGAYFSKPDWHSPNYWWPYFPPKDRNVNYDPAKYPDKWNAFKSYTFRQIKELMSGYGPVDILWLDGGWVRPFNSIDKSIDWQRSIPYNQDIDMERIITMARQLQPGLIAVDRTVTGKFENYSTPEQVVPREPLPYPWESCITMGNSWSYVPDDHYKSSKDLVRLLIRIVSRGGNLLLNIGPSPKGDFSDTAYLRLKEIGEWMDINQSAIYGTAPLSPYEIEGSVFVQSKDLAKKYLFYLPDTSGDDILAPDSLDIKSLELPATIKVKCLSRPGLKLVSDGKVIKFPKKEIGKKLGKYAVVFEIVFP